MNTKTSLFLVFLLLGALVPLSYAEGAEEEIEAKKEYALLKYLKDMVQIDAISNLMKYLYPQEKESNPSQIMYSDVMEAAQQLAQSKSNKQHAAFISGVWGGKVTAGNTMSVQTGNPLPSVVQSGATVGAQAGVMGANMGDTSGNQGGVYQTSDGINGGDGGPGENPNIVQSDQALNTNPNAGTGAVLTTPVSTVGLKPAPAGGLSIFTSRNIGDNKGSLDAQSIVTAQNSFVQSVANVLAGKNTEGSLANGIGVVLTGNIAQAFGNARTGSVANSVATNQNTLFQSVAGVLAGAKTGGSSSAGSIGKVTAEFINAIGHVLSGPTGTFGKTVVGSGAGVAHSIFGAGGSVVRVLFGNFMIFAGPPVIPNGGAVAVVTGKSKMLSYGYVPENLDDHLQEVYSYVHKKTNQQKKTEETNEYYIPEDSERLKRIESQWRGENILPIPYEIPHIEEEVFQQQQQQ
eukprot:gene9139-10718_t